MEKHSFGKECEDIERRCSCEIPIINVGDLEFLLRKNDLYFLPISLLAFPSKIKNSLLDKYYHLRKISHKHYNCDDED